MTPLVPDLFNIGGGNVGEAFTGVLSWSGVKKELVDIINGQNIKDNLDLLNFGFCKKLNSKIISVNLPLKNIFGFCKAYDQVMNGMKISLRLYRNDNSKLAAGIDSIVNINKVA